MNRVIGNTYSIYIKGPNSQWKNNLDTIKRLKMKVYKFNEFCRVLKGNNKIIP